MRLIDADEFLQKFDIGSEEAREENRGAIITAEDIDCMPTAYDVEKVVEQLKCVYKMDCFPCSDTIPCNKCLNKKAISIVKAGGVNE